MQIPFSLPHASWSPSNGTGNAYAIGFCRASLARLERVYTAHHPRGNRPPKGMVRGRYFIFDLPGTFTPDTSPEENAESLRVLLDCLVDINIYFLQHHSKGLPSDVLNLYDSPVVYARTVTWDPIPVLYTKGYGDCKSLSAAVIAQNAIKGIESVPVFRWVRRKDGSGNFDFHILVQTGDGFTDPSKACGMGQDENRWF